MRCKLLAATAILAAMCAVPARAEIYSVLVGASDYGTLEKALRDAGDTQADRVNLKGARNDAILMAQTLMSRGAKPKNVSMLVEHAEKADYPLPSGLVVSGRPTRAEIVDAIQRLVVKANAGDQVVILLSGHGSQQPQRGTLEADGLDEIFIPVDHGAWSGDKSEVRNAIIDDEIAVWIDAIRAKGADVVFIGDFCHSGDSVRGMATGPASIDFQKLLGVPTSRVEAAASAAMTAFKGRSGQRDRRVEVAATGQGRGDFVAFMAAAADTRADQVLGPVYLPRDQRKPGGVLTTYLAAALSDPAVRTYREAATRVQVGYSAQNVPSTPEFEGDLEHAVLSVDGAAAASSAWTVAKPQSASFDRLTLNAGALQGVTAGSIIALSEVQLDKGAQEAVILYGKVASVTAGTALLTPASYGAVTAERWSDVRTASGARFGWAAYLVARVVQNGTQFGFDAAKPRPPANPTSAQRATLAALDTLGAEANGVRLAPVGSSSDYAMAFEGDDLVLSASTAANLAGREIGRISLGEAATARDPEGFLRQRIADALARTVRAAKLQRVIATMTVAPRDDGQPDPAAALGYETRIWIAPVAASGAQAACAPAPTFTADRDFPPGAVEPSALGWTSADAPQLHPCDAVYVRLRNTGPIGADVTGLVIQPTAAVTALKDPVYGVRLEPGATGVYAWQFDPQPGGAAVSDIAFIVVQADPVVRVHADYGNLAQCAATDFTCGIGVTTTRSADQGFAQGSARGFAELMDGVLDGATRSGAVGQAIGSSGVLRSQWRVAPR